MKLSSTKWQLTIFVELVATCGWIFTVLGWIQPDAGAHLAGAGHAAAQRRSHIAQPLTDQFTVGVVARAGQRIQRHAGFQRVDRQQHGQRQRRHGDVLDLCPADVSDGMEARHHHVGNAAAVAAQITDHEGIVRQRK